MKIKKVILTITLTALVLMLSSCKDITLINEVINRNVSYEENISILDFEDAIVEASAIANESSVGVVAKAGNVLFTTESFGSGTIIKRTEISKDLYQYYVLTNRHVVLTNNGNKKTVSVRVNEIDIPAEIQAYDYGVDAAVISFQSSFLLNPAKVCLDEIEVGRFCVAVGNPFDIDKYYNTTTVGNISYSNRVIEEEDSRGNSVNNIYIQHTATLNSGNSGGGLFNIKGELIGINCWKIVDEEIEGMNFSIPLQEVYVTFRAYFE